MTTPIDMSPAKFSVMLRPRHADPRLRYVWNDTAHPNITVTFPEDDNLFMQELFPHFHLNLGYDSARSVVKSEVCSEMHSSQGSGRLPNVHQQYEGLGADPQDQPAEPALQPSNSVPMSGQHALCGGRDTMGVNWLPFSRQEKEIAASRRLL
jgi:hypothetical protein